MNKQRSVVEEPGSVQDCLPDGIGIEELIGELRNESDRERPRGVEPLGPRDPGEGGSGTGWAHPQPDSQRDGRNHIGYFLGGYLFDDTFPVDSELVYGFRFGRQLTDRIDFEAEIVLASAPDRLGEHGFLTDLNLLVTVDLGAGTIDPFVLAGIGNFDFRDFGAPTDTSGLVLFIGAGWKYHVRPRLDGRLELRTFDLSDLADVKDDDGWAILWGVDIAF